MNEPISRILAKFKTKKSLSHNNFLAKGLTWRTLNRESLNGARPES